MARLPPLAQNDRNPRKRHRSRVSIRAGEEDLDHGCLIVDWPFRRNSLCSAETIYAPQIRQFWTQLKPTLWTAIPKSAGSNRSLIALVGGTEQQLPSSAIQPNIVIASLKNASFRINRASTMSIVLPKQAQLFTFSEVLQASFRIPNFQRLYAWGPEQWEALTGDLTDSWAHLKKPLFLGMCVLARGNEVYDVIDGQQRLTTLALLLSALGDDSVLKRFDDRPSQAFISPQEPDGSWFRKILDRETLGEPTRYSQRLMLDAHQYFSKNKFQFDCDFVRKSEIILYCAPSIYGATSLFERINSRGKHVSTLELVKNRLFDWSSHITNNDVRTPLEAEIAERFANVFKHVNPFAAEGEIDADRLLRTHWILLDEDYTKTTDFGEMARKLDDYLEPANIDHSEDPDIKQRTIAKKMRLYLSTLEAVSIYWRKVTAPRYISTTQEALNNALLSFDRLHREANYVPILTAAISAWGETEITAKFVRLIEIICFREALQRDQSNASRTRKWALAKLIYRGKLTPDQAIQKAFWDICPWWDADEVLDLEPESARTFREADTASSAFSDPEAYDHFYRYMRYFFWEYGKWLPKCMQWPETREDISVLAIGQWYSEFAKLEVEHIFPRNPGGAEDEEVKDRVKAMAPYLNHWGNLTLLTKHDNASLQNSVFRKKLMAVLQYNSNMIFNKILGNKDYRGNLSNQAWSPHNCQKRAERLKDFANTRWGTHAMKEFKITKKPT